MLAAANEQVGITGMNRQHEAVAIVIRSRAGRLALGPTPSAIITGAKANDTSGSLGRLERRIDNARIGGALGDFNSLKVGGKVGAVNSGESSRPARPRTINPAPRHRRQYLTTRQADHIGHRFLRQHGRPGTAAVVAPHQTAQLGTDVEGVSRRATVLDAPAKIEMGVGCRGMQLNEVASSVDTLEQTVARNARRVGPRLARAIIDPIVIKGTLSDAGNRQTGRRIVDR